MKKQIYQLTKIGVLIFGISILMWNCQRESETLSPIQDKTDFTSKPVIESFNLNELRDDEKFNDLKNTYNILQSNSSLVKSKKYNSFSARLIDTLGITIDANSIKKISYNSYVSYTMLMIEPEDTSNNFSNLVIQKYNGDKRIFTVRYFRDKTKGKSFRTQKVSENSDNIEIRSGVKSYTDIWGDPDGAGTGGGGGTSACEEYKTMCYTINVWVPHGCGCGHMPGDKCDGCNGNYPHYTLEPQEKCREVCVWESNNGEPVNDNGGWTSGGSSGTGTTGSATTDNDNSENTNVATTPINLDGTSVFGQRLNDYLEANNYSEEAKNWVKKAIELLSLKELLPTDNINTLENRILKITSNLKVWGNPEDRVFANYVESLIPDFNKMTVGDVYDIYKLTRKQSRLLIWKYAEAVVVPFAEVAYPFVIYAVTEATLGAALPLISRIPISMVARGAKLEKLVRKIATLGKAGTSSRIRLISNGNYLKSLKLFNKLTKSAKSIKVETLSNGRFKKIADMGDGNFITFRNFDHSNTPNLVANIDLNFPKIWTKPRELKFIK